jgi:predicted esterase
MGTGMFFRKYGNLAGILIAMSVNVCVAGLGPSVDTAFTADADGTTQRYILRLPSAFVPSEHHDLLIALHGHGADRWQFATDTRDECTAVRDFAGSREMILVCPDYRATTSWMGPLAEQDVVQIIEDFKKNYLINRVFICGASMGGSSALTFTVCHPAMIDGVMAMNPTANHLEYNNFQDAISESFGGTKKDIPGEYKKRSAEYWPEKIVVPVGMTTGGLDSLVPPDSALRLADVLNKIGRKVKSIHRETTGHSTNYADAIYIFTFVADNSVRQNRPAVVYPVLDSQRRSTLRLDLKQAYSVYFSTADATDFLGTAITRQPRAA